MAVKNARAIDRARSFTARFRKDSPSGAGAGA
jgi:hypothetical protein